MTAGRVGASVGSGPARRGLLEALLAAVLLAGGMGAQAQPAPGASGADVLEVVAAPPDDGYWAWLPPFVSEREALDARVGEALLELSSTAHHITTLRARWFELMRLDMELAGVQLESLFDEGPARAGPQTFAALRGERDRLRTEINDQRDVQQRIIEDTVAVLRRVRASLDAQRRRSGPERRRWLADEADGIGELEGLLRLQLLAAAEWHEHPDFGRLLGERTARGADPVATALLDAERHRAAAARLRRVAAIQAMSPAAVGGSGAAEEQARTAVFAAIATLRSALARAPDRRELRPPLLESERELLRLVGAKLERERAVSLHGFHAYLAKRGFDPGRDGGWWQPVRELVTATLTLGPISSAWAQLWGVPDAQAQATIADQERIAQDLVAIAAMVRLNRRGLTVAEMRAIKPDDLAGALAPTAVNRQPLSPTQVRQLWRDLREAFADLAELRALADGDARAFAVRLDAPYVDRIDADQGWGEYWGDAFSVRHLATFWSGLGVAKVGGQWATVVRPAEWAQRTAGAGAVVRTNQWLGQALRLDKVGERLIQTGAGARLRQALLTHRAVVAAQGPWVQVANVAAELGAATILMGGASHLAAESGIPGLQLLVDALLQLNAVELVADALVHAQTPASRLATRLDDWAAQLARERQALARLTADGEALARSLEAPRGTVRRGAGPPPSASRSTTRRDPQGGRIAAEEALAAARRAVDAGDPAEAGRALDALGRITRGMQQQADAVQGRVTRARQLLARAGQGAPPPPTGAAAIDLPLVKDAPADAFVDDRWYGAGIAGQRLRAGDGALLRGDLDVAAERYADARRAAQGGQASGADPAAIEAVLAGRLALAREAAAGELARRGARGTRLGADLPFDEAQAGAAVDGVLNGTAGVLKSGKVYQVGDLVVKRMDESTARTEATAAALGQAIGLDAPATRVVVKGGDAFLVMREVPGTDLGETALPNLLIFRKEYARQRAFRAWIGDTDGHLFNMKVGSDGRLWQIDFDMASLKGTALTHLGGLPLDDQADLIRATMGFVRGGRGLPRVSDPRWWGHHGNARAYLDGQASRDLYAWVAKMDDLVGYDDMKDVVQSIQRLAADEPRLRDLLQASGIADPDAVARALRERAAVLDRVLQEPTLFGRSVRTGALRRPGIARRLVLSPAAFVGLAA